MNNLTKREEKILKIIVEQYNIKYEPISSKIVAYLFGEKISSQTIRNSMANLEKKGFLLKTHTSSGRIPSPNALDFFASNFSDFSIDEIIIQRLESLFIKRSENIDSVINDSLAILNEITNLPSITNFTIEDETLREVNLVQLNDNNALILIVTNLGNIYKNYIYINNDRQIKDIKVCIRLFNDMLIGVPISLLNKKITEIIPIIKKEVYEYDFVTKEIIYKLFNYTLKNINNTNVVGITSLSQYPEFRDPNVIFKVLDMVENGTIWQQIKNDLDEFDKVKIEYRPIDENKNNVFMIATTELSYNNIKRQISIIGPSRSEIAKIKGTLNYLRNLIEKMFEK